MENGVTPECGGTQAQRGFEFQAYSLIFYSLVRCIRFHNLQVSVETWDDARITYDLGDGSRVQEFIQCKKRETAESGVLRPGWNLDVIELGAFAVADLRDWVTRVTAGSSVEQRLRADESAVFTALVLGTLSKHLRDYTPPGITADRPIVFLPADFNDKFAPGFVHPHDPGKRPKDRFGGGDEGLRRRLRIIPMGSWQELEVACQIVLTSHFGVTRGLTGSSLSDLIAAYRIRATANDARLKIISKGDIDQILAPHRTAQGRWVSVKKWLCADHAGRGAVPERAHSLSWKELAESRFVHRGEFDETLAAIQRGPLVLLHGHAGAGKTSTAAFAAYSHVSQHPDASAYYLAVSEGDSLETEFAFSQQQPSAALFVLDDEQCNRDAVTSFVSRLEDQRIAGHLRGRFIVTSTATFSQMMLGDHERGNHPLTSAIPVKFSKLSVEMLGELLDRLCERNGWRPTISSREISRISGGLFGLALLVAQAASEDIASVMRLLSSGRLKKAIETWVMKTCGIAEDAVFRDILVPAFIASAFDVSVLPLMPRAVDLLTRGGFLEASTSDKQAQPDAALSVFVTQSHRDRVAEVFSSLITQDDRLVPVVLRALARNPFGHESLKSLVVESDVAILDALRRTSPPLPLRDVVGILDAVFTVDRGLGVRLLRAFAAPHGAPRLDLFRDMLRIDRVQRPRDVGAFFTTLWRGDRHLSRIVASALAEPERMFLQAMFESDQVQLDEVATALAAINRCAPDFAAILLRRLDASQTYSAMVASQLQASAQMPSLVRYCAALTSLDRRSIDALLDRFLNVEAVTALFRDTQDFARYLRMLIEVRKMRPRFPHRAVAGLWNAYSQDWIERCEESGSLVEMVNHLGLTRRLNGRVAHHLSQALEPTLRKAVAAGRDDYTSLASALAVLSRLAGWQYAHNLASSVDRSRVLEEMRREAHKLTLVGISLRYFAQVDRDLGADLEAGLSLLEMSNRVSSAFLHSLAHLIDGFLFAASASQRASLMASITSYGPLRELLVRAWADERSALQSAACLQLLYGAGLDLAEILTLLGKPNIEDVFEDLKSRLATENNVLTMATVLHSVALVDMDLARRLVPQVGDWIRRTMPQRREHSTSRGLPRGFQPNNFADMGTCLRIVALLDPSIAEEIVARLDLDAWSSFSHNEPNLGRLTAFVVGVHESSRSRALAALDALQVNDSFDHLIRDNETPGPVLQFAATVAGISASRGRRLIQEIVTRQADNLEVLLEVEADLTQATRWLRTVASTDPEEGRKRLERLRGVVVDIGEYDSRLWSLLECTEAMIECGDLVLAKEFAERSLAQGRQLLGVTTLQHFVRIVQKAAYIGSSIGDVDFISALLRPIDTVRFSWYIAREVGNRRRSGALVLQFLDAVVRQGSGNGLEKFGSLLTAALKALDDRPAEAGSTLTELGRVLGGSASGEGSHPLRIWQAGLIYRVAQCFDQDVEATLSRLSKVLLGPLSGSLPRELTEHARTLEFGLAYNLVQALDPGGEWIRAVAHDRDGRREDEPSKYIRSLLAGSFSESTRPRPWEAWRLLTATIFRAESLPWADFSREAAKADILRQRTKADYGELAR